MDNGNMNVVYHIMVRSVSVALKRIMRTELFDGIQILEEKVDRKGK